MHSSFQSGVLILGLFFSLLSPWETFAQPVKLKKNKAYVQLHMNLDSFYVAIDDDFDHVIRCGRNTLLELQPGMRKIRIISKQSFDYLLNKLYLPGKLHHERITLSPSNLPPEEFNNYSSYLRIYWNANLVIFTDKNSKIYVDGNEVRTGAARLNLSAGYHQIETVHPVLGRKVKKVFIEDARLKIFKMFRKPRKWISIMLGVIPGASQIYRNKKIKGLSLFALNLGSVLAWIQQNEIYHRKLERYRDLQKEYSAAETELEALALGNRMDELYARLNSDFRVRNIYLSATVLFYAYNLIDAFRKDKTEYADFRHFNEGKRFLFQPLVSSNQFKMKVSFNF